MSALDLEAWWDRCSEDQRRRLKAAAVADRRDAAEVRLLVDTGCPIGPVGSSIAQSDYTWDWPGNVRRFVRDQPAPD